MLRSLRPTSYRISERPEGASHLAACNNNAPTAIEILWTYADGCLRSPDRPTPKMRLDQFSI